MRPDPSGCPETITLSARVKHSITPPWPPPQRKKKKNHPSSWNVLPIGTSWSNESRQARPRVLLFIGHKKGIHSREKGLLTKVQFTCSLIARKKERIEGSERKRERLREGQKKNFSAWLKAFSSLSPNPIILQFKQMKVCACFAARCRSNKDINSEDGKFERQ